MKLDEPIWASLPVPALLLDADDQIVDMNPACEDFLGASARSTKGTIVWQRLDVEQTVQDGLNRMRANRAPLFVNDVEIRKWDKVPSQCTLQMAPVVGQDNMYLLVISPREFASQLTFSNSARLAVKSAIGMAELLAHEIKNPLAGIIGAAQLLSMKIGLEAFELSDHIVNESRRIEKLLQQVEQFGDLSSPNFQSTNIHDVLARVRQSALLGFGSHVQIAEEYDPSLPLARCDPDQMVQVFLNLMKNSAEVVSTESGRITIRTFFEHSYSSRRNDGSQQSLPLHVELIDNGPGISDKIKSEMFNPFVSSKKNGSGLGLALVSKIIADHDGWIAVSSRPGKTVFRVSLPRA